MNDLQQTLRDLHHELAGFTLWMRAVRLAVTFFS